MSAALKARPRPGASPAARNRGALRRPAKNGAAQTRENNENLAAHARSVHDGTWTCSRCAFTNNINAARCGGKFGGKPCSEERPRQRVCALLHAHIAHRLQERAAADGITVAASLTLAIKLYLDGAK